MVQTAGLFVAFFKMTYVVTDACIRCKYMDCVDVCPVDCFYEGANMLVIDPQTCIDCGVCVPECPVGAISSDVESGMEKWVKLNGDYAKVWPRISEKGLPPSDADKWKETVSKYEKYFDPNPGNT